MRLAFFVLLAAVLVCSPVLAQDAATDEARGAFAAGQAAYSAGRFAEALGYFERAYELTREPDLLFNIATVHDRLRHDAQALEAYRGYLEARPDAEDRANIEARIAVLEEAARSETPAPPAEVEPDAEPEPQAEPEAEAELASGEAIEAAPSRASGVGPAPWIVVGVGGAFLVAGVALLVVTQIDLDAVSSGTRWADVHDAYDRVPVLSAAGWSIAGAGLAAIAGGLIWAAVGNDGGAEVAIGPGSVLVRGTF